MVFLLVVWVSPSQANLLGDYWSRFDRFLATFDPAGRYVRQPIEKQIPALTFKGFYRQWSDISLTSDQRVANREKDFRFLQLQNLFELEMHYQVSPNIEITNVNHFLYDGVYNWQDSDGLVAPRSRLNWRFLGIRPLFFNPLCFILLTGKKLWAVVLAEPLEMSGTSFLCFSPKGRFVSRVTACG